MDNMDLGFLGPGFPLFFILMKYLCIYMFCITLIYFAPVAYVFSQSLQELDSSTDFFTESKLAMFSYGAFVAGTSGTDGYTDGVDKIDFKKRQQYINLLSGVFFASIVFSFLFFILLRRQLYLKAEQLNAKSLTAADYCIMIMNCSFEDNGNSELIFNDVKEVMQERFEIGDKVQYTNAAYDINDFYECSASVTELNGYIGIVEHYIS
jgi:hypothetical protein